MSSITTRYKSFLFKIGLVECTIGSREYEKVEYSRRLLERQLGMLKVNIFIEPNNVNSNGF